MGPNPQVFFPGSYLTLLIIPEPFLILFKCDIRMDFISHMPSPRSISNSFHCWLNLFGFSFSQSISTIHGGSHHHSQHLKIEEEFFFLQILSVLSEIRDSSLLPSSHNCFRLWESFSPIRRYSRVFSVCHLESINSDIFILSCQLSIPYLAGASIEYPLISSWSLSSHVSSLFQAPSFIC